MRRLAVWMSIGLLVSSWGFPLRADWTFVRGDANRDHSVDFVDVISLLDTIFSANAPALLCEDAADANDSGAVEFTDAIYLLQYLFNFGAPPPPPYPHCLGDPTPDPIDCLGPLATCPETLAEIQFSTAGQVVEESEIELLVPVTLSEPLQNSLSLQFTVTGTAENGFDYQFRDNSFTIDAGSLSHSIAVLLREDVIYEGTETLTVSLEVPNGLVGGLILEHTITLLDNDTFPEVTFSDDLLTTSEGAGSVMVDIELSLPSEHPVIIGIAQSGSAEPGADYLIPSNPFVIAPGSWTKTIQITLLDDSVFELRKEIQLVINSTSGATLGEQPTTLLIIEDDDPAPEVSFVLASSTHFENTPTLSVSIVMEPIVGVDMELPISISGSATIGNDFSSPPNIVLVPSGSNSTSITIVPLDDFTHEGEETIEINFGNLEAASIGLIGSHIITLLDDDPPPTFFFTESQSSAHESVQIQPIEFQLTNPSTVPVTAMIARSGTAEEQIDYSPLSSFEIPAGSTTGFLNVHLLDNLMDQNDRTLSITIHSVIGATVEMGSTHHLTILDDDPQPTIHLSPPPTSTLLEDASTLSIELLLDAPSLNHISVPITVGGSALIDVDFSISPLTVEFAPGETSRTLTLTTFNDIEDEITESIVLALGQPTNALVVEAEAETIFIIDDDGIPEVTLSVASSLLSEGDGEGTVAVYVNLSKSSDREVSVPISLQGTAIAGEDYLFTSTQLDFTPGQITSSFSITVLDDLLHEETELIEIELGLLVGAEPGEPSHLSIQLIDNDSMPLVSFAETTSQVSEGDEDVTLEIVLDETSGVDVEVQLQVTGTATLLSDYLITPNPVTIAAGESSATLRVILIDDSIFELPETIQVTLGDTLGAMVGINSTHDVTLNDNGDPPPSLEFVADEQIISEGVANLTLDLRLSVTSEFDIVVPVTVSGIANQGLDFLLQQSEIVIPAGQVEAALSVSIIDDTLDEATEDATIALGIPTHGTLGSNSTHTIQIVDNDDPPEIALLATSSAIEEGSPEVVFSVELSAPSSQVVSAPLILGGTASVGADYTVTPVSILIQPGEQQATITLQLLDDLLAESTEHITLSLGEPTNADLSQQPAAILTILDNDASPVVTVKTTEQSRGEDAGMAAFEIQLSRPSSLDVTVPIHVSGTATNTVDFTLVQSPIVIPAGSTSAGVTIFLIDDLIYEHEETALFTLAEPIHATLGTPSTHTLTILDAGDPVPSLTFAQPSSLTVESNQSVFISVQLSASTGHQVSVGIDLGGSATPNFDYIISNSTAIIPPGQTSTTFVIQVLDDYAFELTETVIMSLRHSSDYSLGQVYNHTLTLTDNDSPPTVSFSSEASSTEEGSIATHISVDLSNAAGLDLEIPFVMGGTARVHEDYELPVTPLTITAGATTAQIEIPIIDDGYYEGAEFINLTLTPPFIADLGTITSHQLTITDNEELPELSITIFQQTINEADHFIPIQITQSVPTETDVVVPWTVHGTALENSDFVLAPNPAVIPARFDSTTLNLVLINDEIPEPSETIVITLDGPIGDSIILPPPTTLTVEDDGDASPVVGFSTPTQSTSEGAGTISVVVELSAPSGLPIVIPYSLSGTSESGVDFFVWSEPLTISPGDLSTHIPVTLVDDLIHESVEEVNFELGDPTNALLSETAEHLLIIEDNDAPPTVNFQSLETNVYEIQEPTTVKVTIDTPSAHDISIPYTLNGTAISGLDFTLSESLFFIPAGSNEGEIPLQLLNDDVFEETESIHMTLGSAIGVQLGAQITHTISIEDDESPPVISFSLESSEIVEGDTSFEVSIELSGFSSSPVQASLSIGGTADPTLDYTQPSLQLEIPPHSTLAKLTVNIHEDQIDEHDETIVLVLDSAVDALPSGRISHTVHILDNDDPVVVGFSTDANLVLESSGQQTLVIHLSAVSGIDVTLDLQTSGIASQGADYLIPTELITISAGSLERSISIDILNDDIDEVNESLVISLSGVVGAVEGLASEAEITILDDDPTPSLQFETATSQFSEPYGTALLTVQLSEVSGQDIFFDLLLSGTATSGVDYTLNLHPVLIEAGQTYGFVFIDIVDDLEIEGLESLNLTLVTPAGAVLGSQSQHMITIIDDDIAPAVTFSSSNQAVQESDHTTEIEIVLSEPTALDVTIPFTVTGTAQFSADYQISTLPLVIPSGYTTGIIYVTLLEDYLVESDEVISVVLGPPTNGVLGEPSIHHVTILDNEPPPIAQFTTNSTLVSESENTTTFVVELSHSSTADVVLELLLTGTAIAGSDYTVGSQTIIIPAGSLYTEVEFVILEDGLYEITETTAVELTSPLNAILGPNAIALLEIVDNDPIPVVNFSQSSSSGSEHTNLINIDVSLSSPAGHDVILHYTVSAEAEPGIDFSITSSPIVFPSGTTQGSITLIPSPDDLDEPDEAIVISLSQPSGAVLGPINQHTATIIDANPPPVIEFNSVTSTTLEGDAETAVFVSLSGPISTAISVPYTITGSATENEDFLVSSSTIQFPPRVTHMALNVDLISDTLFESAETITFVMLPTSVVTLGTRSEHTLTILDDDPQPEVSFQITAQSVVEDAGVARVALQLSSVSGVDTIVPLGISGGGTVSEDYFPSVASITILAGYATGELLIDILDDYIQETDETLTVALGVPVGAQLGTITTHLLTITDNDPPPTISFLQSDFHLGEGEGSTFIEVALSAPSIETVHTTVSVVGSAMVDIDYLITPQVLFFVPGQTTQTISVTALDDLAHEATETVTLSLDPMDNAGLGENPFTTVHVIDNDVVPTVSFATTSTSSNENGGMISLVLALNTVSNLPVTVPFSIGGTATNFVDYVIDASPAVIPAGSLTTSIMVLPIPDPVAEPNETIRVTLIGATNGSLGLKRVHEVTLHNESELPAVFFSEASQTISESSGSASFSLRLAAVSALTVDVTLSFSGTAQSPDDYAQPPALVSFPPGIQEILFSIPITDDSIDEDDEVIELNLLGASGATVGTPQQHVITLLDDDSPPTVFFPMTSVQQVEDFVTIHLPIRLTKISSLPVTAHYTFGGNAIEGEDFTITPSPVTISPGELESTIAVTIFSDVIADENEVLIVALQSAENAVLGTDHLVTLEILDDQSTPLISFTTSAQSVSESDDAIIVEVSLSRIFESDQIISISITGSAETGSDYTISSNPLTIPTGSVTGSMILTPLIDQVHEGAETVILTLSAPPGTALGDHATHTITILDDDSAPLVNLEPLPSSVVEGEPSLTLEATLSNLSSLPVLVVLSFSGTAHLGIDYTASNSVLFIAPNSTTGFIELSIADDLIIEGSETVEIQIVNAAGGIVGATDTTSFVILDSDHLPTVSFDSSSSTVEEGVSNHLISLTLSSESPNLVTVPISFQGTAVSSLDFIATPIPVVFSPGQTSTSITINVLDDDLHESVEIVTLSLGSLTGALTGEITQHTITVSDADPPPIVNVVTQETSIDESGGVTSILVTLSAISGLEVTIPYTFGGSASSADHGAEPGSLVIPAGTINGTIEVPVFDDLLHEDDELLILFLGMATNATTGLPNQFDLTIIDNDDAPGVRFTTASQSVTESEQNLTVSLELSSISGLETIVDLSLSGTASSPEDYSLPASQVSIPAGSVGSTVSVSIVEDNIFEGSEELVITIASVVGGTPIPPSTHVVTIEDSMSQPLVNFIGTSSEISEGLESIQVTVELSAPTDLEITVPYQVLASSTALVGTDFVIAPSPLVFTPGEVGGLISISIIDDAAAEISETIDLQILSPNNASLGNLTQHTVTILDDDDLPCDLAYSQADVVYPPGVLISPNLPSVSCGIPTSWSVTPQLPNGLSLDETSGEIFGTPVDRSARTDHAITASNTHGSTTTTISIAIDFIFYYTGTSETALYNPATGELVAPLSIIPVSLFYREDPHNFPVPNTFHETKGLSTSIQHDPLQLTAVQVEIGADLTTLNGGMGPDFFGPLLGSNVVTIGVVYSIELLEQVTVTADVEREIASIHYAPLPGLLIGNMAGLTLTLPWGHPLGALGIQNEIVIDGATGVTPLTTDPTIELIAQ